MARYNDYADLVDMADAGAPEGRVGAISNRGGRIWRLTEVSNQPGRYVYSTSSSRWCYAPADLIRDERLRASIKMTAEMGRRVAAQRAAVPA